MELWLLGFIIICFIFGHINEFQRRGEELSSLRQIFIDAQIEGANYSPLNELVNKLFKKIEDNVRIEKINADKKIQQIEEKRCVEKVITDEKIQQKEEEIRELRNERDMLNAANEAQKKIIENIRRELSNTISNYKSELSKASSSYEELNSRFNIVQNNEILFKKTLSEAPLGFPSLLQAIQVYDEQIDEVFVQKLKNTKPRAPKASEDVKKANQKRREAELECRQAKALMEYYFSIFPEIEESKEILSEEVDPIERVASEDEDVTKRYLQKDEYQNLSATERNQLALDRFWERDKSKYLIGKLYEQYVGYLYEEKGYQVEYFGIAKGKEDLGRDLICRNEDETLLIQCKNWSKSKTIYEKHIFQLFGTVYQYSKQHPMENTHAAFYTATHLSDFARSFAKDFGMILCEDFQLQKFPIIKCNVGRDGERIYHLPFDQQYDVTKVNKKDGDFYCLTVAEAAAKGFRRAYRWHGNNY